MKSLFDEVSIICSKVTTKKYSTSFSLGILFLHPKLRSPIYSIYGFVRFADEIVDSFHEYDKEKLLNDFEKETFSAIKNKISLNPILNSFQHVVHQYNINNEWITTFLESMKMDLNQNKYDRSKFNKYIMGSAEVVGLMCLHVFTEGDKDLFDKLKPFAMKLGAAFQKVNFLRDIQSDLEDLGRVYFPNIDIKNLSQEDKIKIENEIELDFREALLGIRMLPQSSRKGVYLAYYYYRKLFKKIKRLPPKSILSRRVRIPNTQKIVFMFKSNVRHHLNLL